MTDQVRVRNVTNHDVGVVKMNGMGVNIKPNLFINMSRDDIEYNMGSAPALFDNPPQLVVEDEEINQNMGIDPEREIITEDVAERYLKGSVQKLKSWLTENDYPHVKEIVFNVAKKMDLPASKIRVLNAFMPTRDVMGEEEE